MRAYHRMTQRTKAGISEKVTNSWRVKRRRSLTARSAGVEETALVVSNARAISGVLRRVGESNRNLVRGASNRVRHLDGIVDTRVVVIR